MRSTQTTGSIPSSLLMLLTEARPSRTTICSTLCALSRCSQMQTTRPIHVKNPTNPRSGIATQAAGSIPAGEFVDPWGAAYKVRIDGGYDNQVANPYTANAGATPNLQIGVIAWSVGVDGSGPPAVPGGDKNTGVFADDVISWQ